MNDRASAAANLGSAIRALASTGHRAPEMLRMCLTGITTVTLQRGDPADDEFVARACAAIDAVCEHEGDDD